MKQTSDIVARLWLGSVQWMICWTMTMLGGLASKFQSLSPVDDIRHGDVTSTMVGEAPACMDAEGRDADERNHVLEAKHKTFLSHSGAQKSFVADLCDDLMRRDRHPFFDRLRSSLPIGERFPNRIFDAIRQCDVGVVVLSEEFFTRSKWPMLELVAMVEESRKPNRKIKIIPVFYSISRERCRDPDVQSKWIDHWNRWKREDKGRIDVEKWKSALGIFGSTTGLVMKEGMLDRELRKEIVDAICQKVPGETRWDDSGVAGKTRLCVEICKKLYKGLQPEDLEGGVRVVGLYGMGGIGKTTACKIVCNELWREYHDRVCHVELGSKSEVKLLRKFLSKVSDLDDKILGKLDVDGCYGYLKSSHIVKERVILALDNVSDDSEEQAKKYLKANFGDGSVVLVTARSMDQLQRLGVVKDDCFAMPELELEEAESLFLSHADLKANDIDKDVLEKCIRRCHFSKSGSLWTDDRHYHPLALKVLGREVGDLVRQGREVLPMIETLNPSRKGEHPVFSILRSSFDSMVDEDKRLFLDVALICFPPGSGFPETLEWLCLVHGKDVEKMTVMLECLKRRSLLESFGEGYNEFGMHDLWREFAKDEMKAGKFKYGRFVLEGEECEGRVDLTEFPKLEVVCLLGLGNIESVDVQELKHLKSLIVDNEGMCFEVNRLKQELKGLGTLERLRCLILVGASSAGIAELGYLTNLQDVSLFRFEGDKLPDMNKLTNLRSLSLSSASLKSINLRNFPNLRALCLVYCDQLRIVDVSGCQSLVDFYIHIDSLEELDVSFCPRICSLDICGYNYNLRKLDITGCSSLRNFDFLSTLNALDELRARKCESTAMLPESVLRKLRVLDIEDRKVPVQFDADCCAKLELEFEDAKRLFLRHAELNMNDIGQGESASPMIETLNPSGQENDPVFSFPKISFYSLNVVQKLLFLDFLKCCLNERIGLSA